MGAGFGKPQDAVYAEQALGIDEGREGLGWGFLLSRGRGESQQGLQGPGAQSQGQVSTWRQ